MGIKFGNYLQKIDSTRRVTFPSKLVESFLNKNFFICANYDETIIIRTEDQFIDFQKSLNKLPNSANARQLQRFFLGNSFEVKLDKSNRFMIPESLMEIGSLKAEVVFVGTHNGIEIISNSNWKKINSKESILKTQEELEKNER